MQMMKSNQSRSKSETLYKKALSKMQKQNIEFGKASDHIFSYGPRQTPKVSANS